MSDVWKDWEGQVADHKYQLRQFLGSTDHSVVFLAEFRDPEPHQAAIKFVAADTPNPERQLAAWKVAAELKHPNLLPLLGCGRCKIADTDLLYVVMEHADENLAQVLPQRALAREEAREVMNALVEVLVFLHGKNLTHGHVKPSNILAAGDRLKISSDTIQSAGTREMNRKRSQYDAPEIPAAAYTPASDVWSLGVMLVEALTQQPAILPFNEKADPVVSPAVSEPFFGIAEYALRREPATRATSAQIAERLSPAMAAVKPAAVEPPKPATSAPRPAAVPKAPAAVEPKAAAAAASATAQSPTSKASASPAAPAAAAPMPMPAPAMLAVSPLDVPLSKEPALPPDKRRQAAAQYPPVSRPPVRPAPREPRTAQQWTRPITLPNYVVPLAAALLVLVVIIALPKILRRSTQPPPSTATTSTSAPPPTTSAPKTPSSSASAVKPSTKPSAPPKSSPADAGRSTAQSTPSATPAPPASSPEFKASRSALGKGEPLDQVLPDVPGKALSTIQGTVRVVIKANVNASGRVSEAVLDNPGPSRYFADNALAAARQWEFSSPVMDGRSVPSEWLIRFEFTRDGVNAYPSQTKP
jgi:TonB family protein